MQEQRKNRRFDLQLPFELVRAGAKPVESSGHTKNISSGGVLFVAEADVEIGEPIEYILTLPTGTDQTGTVSLRCVGKVVRTQNSDPSGANRVTAVAATLERYEFQRLRSTDDTGGE